MLNAALLCVAMLTADAENIVAEGSAHWMAVTGEIPDPPPLSPVDARSQATAKMTPTAMVQGYLKAGATSASVPRWDLLTQVIWFGVTMNPSGTLASGNGIGDAKYLDIVSVAHAHGVQVLIGAILFNTTASPNNVANIIANKATMIPTLVNLMLQHDADGISLDYEVVPESSKAAYVTLLQELSAAAKAAKPGAHITSAIPPPTGWKGYDYVGITANSDSAFVMAYDYHYLGGPPGPVTTKNDGTAWGSLNYTQSLNKFSSTLTPAQKQKLVIGLPWYGYNWPTTTAGAFAAVDKMRTKKPFAQTFAGGRSLIEGPSGLFDSVSEQPWASYTDGGFRQLWLDDATSFGAKAQMVVDGAFGGLGLFALAYEGSDPGMWAQIENRFATSDTQQPPVAVITVDSSTRIGKTLTASAAESSDPDGDALTYRWSCDGCSVLSAAQRTTLLAFAEVRTVTLTLTVSDGTSNTVATADIEVAGLDTNTTGGTDGSSSGGTTGKTTGGSTGKTTGKTSGGTTGSKPQGATSSGESEQKTGCRATRGLDLAAVLAAVAAGVFRRRGRGRETLPVTGSGRR